jgi:oligosaccharide repeat unit polymerase
VSYPVPTVSSPARAYAAPTPSIEGTICFLGGLFLAYMSYTNEKTSAGMAQVVAVYAGSAFLLSTYFDGRKGLYNLLRTDLMCLIGIYALTLLEFLFPQPIFDQLATPTQTKIALDVVMVGMGALSVGRHLVKPTPIASKWLNLADISSRSIFRLFTISACLAYFYMLMTVQFNPVALIHGMIGPRFSEPWGRGYLGGWKDLLYELNLFSYAIPPLAGVIWNRRTSFSIGQRVFVAACLTLALFHGFAGGTRNIFVTYVSTLLMGYLISLRKHTFRNTVLPILVAVLIGGYASYHMLAFRMVGLQYYVTHKVYAIEKKNDTLAVDYNLASLGKVADALPARHPFLGLEVLTWALVKPIPRAMWPSKPVGLSVSIEELVGAKGWSVAATYLGESYMMGGMFGVIGMSLFFGAVAAWWNRMAMQQQSDYALVVYALGFFAAGLTMRSMFWFTTAILPVIAMIVFRRLKFLQ